MNAEVEDGGLRRTALRLVWAGEIWNGFEAGVALWSGLGAGSVALLGFGLDSFIELFAGAVLIRHLGKSGQRTTGPDGERRAHRLVAGSFFVLSAFIVVQSTATLAGGLPRPQESLVGIAIVLASLAVMTALYLRKMPIARRLGSRALRAEAIETLVCDAQDLTVLLGLGLNALIGWWWADPIAALGLVPFLVWEGGEGLSETDST